MTAQAPSLAAAAHRLRSTAASPEQERTATRLVFSLVGLMRRLRALTLAAWLDTARAAMQPEPMADPATRRTSVAHEPEPPPTLAAIAGISAPNAPPAWTHRGDQTRRVRHGEEAAA